MALEKEVERLKLELNQEKSFSYRMKDRFQRYNRIAKHLAGRELAHVQRMDIEGQLWRVSKTPTTVRPELSFTCLKHIWRDAC